jgi:cathepsin X
MRAGQHLRTPQPHTYLDVDALPGSFSWGSANGTNFLTTIRNQHIPVYCGSCWAMGSSSALADRSNIKDGARTMRQNMLSVQAIISCGNDATSCGTCDGGDDGPVYQWAKEAGIPHESCSNYMATDTTCRAGKVSAKNKPECYTCSPSGTPACKAIKKFKKLRVSEYGVCSGYGKMKAEIFARGPISCGVDATDKMEAYTGGVYSEKGTSKPLLYCTTLLLYFTARRVRRSHIQPYEYY